MIDEKTVETLKQELIKSKQTEIDALAELALRPRVVLPFKPNNKKHELTNQIGVYIIWYFNDGRPLACYVGCGNMIQRRSTHYRVFANQGKHCNFKNSSVDSPVARKMYGVNPDSKHWIFHCYSLGHKDIPGINDAVRELEKILIKQYTPALNDPKMAGK